jgi:hypothetical protein
MIVDPVEPTEYGPLSDEALVEIADEPFRELDAHEAADRPT